VNKPGNVPRRALIKSSAIGATLLQSLDQAIANVAFPYTRGSFDGIIRVLTSSIAAAAIMTAPVGWLAGRTPIFIGCILRFTIASTLCEAPAPGPGADVHSRLPSSLALATPGLPAISDNPAQTTGMTMAPHRLGNLAAVIISFRPSSPTDPLTAPALVAR
jgi:hypothetical protein